MFLNGGIGYSGGMCGTITGAAMALGELAQSRLDNHRTAKKVARRIMIRIMDLFLREYSSTNCGDLIDYDISVPREHERFIESGVWRSTCMNQIEFVVNQLHRLAYEEVWQEWVKMAFS